jgi:hypothetical protein
MNTYLLIFLFTKETGENYNTIYKPSTIAITKNTFTCVSNVVFSFSLESAAVYMNQDWVSDTWILQLGAVRRVHLTFTSEVSMETHVVEFMLKSVGQDHGDRKDPCWSDRSF